MRHEKPGKAMNHPNRHRHLPHHRRRDEPPFKRGDFASISHDERRKKGELDGLTNVAFVAGLEEGRRVV